MAKSRKSQANVRKRSVYCGTSTMPVSFREGEILTDIMQNEWKIGKSLGCGGFGEIYAATKNNYSTNQESKFAVKIEPHTNGPLFVEANFYMRVAKEEKILKWKAEKRLKHLGMPHFVSRGSHVYNGERYRFLVLQQFGQDLGKLFVKKKQKFHLKTVLTLGIQILDVLDYLHSNDYVHADIKGSNILLNTGVNGENEVYLIDYGLASRYVYKDGTHKEFDPDLRRAHDGTLEYTSRDAHIGAHSRRGDLEMLGYNMVQWLCGSLPWEDELMDPEEIARQKDIAMNNIPAFLKKCFQDEVPVVLHNFLKYVANLSFEQKPDYSYCKTILRCGIKQAGFADDNKLNFYTAPARLKSKKRARRNDDSDIENIVELKPIKAARYNRQPCVAVQQNTNRMTRSAATVCHVLRSKEQFDWVKVLQSNPEKIIFPPNQVKKIKSRSKSITPGEIKSVETKYGKIYSPRKNPTYAMSYVMNKYKNISPSAPGKRLRADSRCASPIPDDSIKRTPAMEEVLRNKEIRNETQSCPIVKVQCTRSSRSRRKCFVTPLPIPAQVNTETTRKKPIRKISAPQIKNKDQLQIPRTRTRKYSLEETKTTDDSYVNYFLLRDVGHNLELKTVNVKSPVNHRSRRGGGVKHRRSKSASKSRISRTNKKLPTVAKHPSKKTLSPPFVFKPKSRREVSPSNTIFVPRLRSGKFFGLEEERQFYRVSPTAAQKPYTKTKYSGSFTNLPLRRSRSVSVLIHKDCSVALCHI